MLRVDLNSDIGESFGKYQLGCDKEIVKYISSANIACGWHAGDPLIMDETVKLCKEHGIAFGAHPGYPDLLGFGRRKMAASRKEVKAYVKYQLGALMAFAASHGVKVQHMKPHGAMGNTSLVDLDTAYGVCEAVAEVDPTIIMLSHSNLLIHRVAKEFGLRTANEVYADRAYNDDYTLVARGTPGAMIDDPEAAVQRVIRMIKEGLVTSITGKELEIPVQSVCVHGDSQGAVEITRGLRLALEAEGIEIAPICSII